MILARDRQAEERRWNLNGALLAGGYLLAAAAAVGILIYAPQAVASLFGK